MKTQWTVFPSFLVVFLAGVVLWLVMMKRYGFFTGAAGISNRQSDRQSGD